MEWPVLGAACQTSFATFMAFMAFIGFLTFMAFMAVFGFWTFIAFLALLVLMGCLTFAAGFLATMSVWSMGVELWHCSSTVAQ